MTIKTLAAAVALAFAANAGAATTITVTDFDAASYQMTARSLGTSTVEDFESYSEASVANGFSTSVGTFSSIGGQGSGGTVTQSGFANDGSTLTIRDANVFGRSSTTSEIFGDKTADKFLDSNDTFGIAWTATRGGGLFDKILLTLRDGAEFGAMMHITVDGQSVSFAGNGNADTRMVLIDFGQAVRTSRITFANLNGQNNLTNDGFSIDDIAISAVPLPASSLLLLAGLGGLGALKRRRKAA